MSNCCIGSLRIVTKNNSTIGRVQNILEYKDEEFCLSGCKEVYVDCSFTNGEYFVCDFKVVGAWNCGRFFTTDENPNLKAIVGYEKDDKGFDDYGKPIYGTAHITNLCKLAEKLGFGCELFSVESDCCFCEHYLVTNDGELVYNETGSYKEEYPTDSHGEPRYDKNPRIEYGISNFGEDSKPSEIYGN